MRDRFSRSDLLRVIDGVEVEFEKCWKVLSDMKSGNPDRLGQDFVEFQVTLAEALYTIDKTITRINEEERKVVGRKKSFDSMWFRSVMARRYLKRVGPLTKPVEFYFLDTDGHRVIEFPQ